VKLSVTKQTTTVEVSADSLALDTTTPAGRRAPGPARQRQLGLAFSGLDPLASTKVQLTGRGSDPRDPNPTKDGRARPSIGETIGVA
ncbi:MAG: hypothetical protein ACLQRH_10810, partial [Acidimicrobiales bacterium]